jgi:hypothetical protein
MKKPYLSLYKKQDGFKIYIVDGSYIRKSLNDQFTDFGQHYRFPKMIPTKEIWLDHNFNHPDEYKYFIAHAIREWELMNKGKSYKTAITEADELEWNMRNRDEHGDYKIKKLEEIDGVTVWLVNGKAIRDDCHIDFTEGGHDLVYEFIPENEIWISDEVSAKERPYILAHEYNERCSMSKGEDYEHSHNKASFFERKLRHIIPNIGRLNAKKSGHDRHSHGRVHSEKSLGQMR